MSDQKKEFAVIETGGKQYIVEQDTIISIEKLPDSKSKTFTFDTVLLHSKNGKLSVGNPYIKLNVKAEILANETDKKVRVFKFKPKTGYKKKQGHRQTYTTVKITSIGTATASADAKSTQSTTSKAKRSTTNSTAKSSSAKEKTSSEKKS